MSKSSTTKIKNKIKALVSSLELRVISSFTTFIMEGRFLYRCGEHIHNIWTTRHRDGVLKKEQLESGNDCTSCS